MWQLPLDGFFDALAWGEKNGFRNPWQVQGSFQHPRIVGFDEQYRGPALHDVQDFTIERCANVEHG